MSKTTILSMDSGHPGQIEALERHFDVIRPGKPDPERIIRDRQKEIQGITTFLTPVSKNLIEALPNLEIIATGAVGTDHIDLNAARGRSIAVTNTPDVLTDDTADVAMLLMLNVARRAVEGDAYVRAGLWNNGPLSLGTSLSGKKIGIVGLGRIGQAVARRAEAFNMDISYHGPREKPDQPYTYYKDIEALAHDVDFLILTCPGGPATHHLVDYKILQA
jgi:hydroxypyruvate reductase